MDLLLVHDIVMTWTHAWILKSAVLKRYGVLLKDGVHRALKIVANRVSMGNGGHGRPSDHNYRLHSKCLGRSKPG